MFRMKVRGVKLDLTCSKTEIMRRHLTAGKKTYDDYNIRIR